MLKHDTKKLHKETDILRDYIIKNDRIGNSLENLADNILLKINKDDKDTKQSFTKKNL